MISFAGRGIRWTARAARELADLNDSPAYFDRLVARVEKLAELPGMGRFVPHRPDVRRFLSGAHYVYFRDHGSEIVILRITHVRRQLDHL